MKTKTSVRKEFSYMRVLLQQADKLMAESKSYFNQDEARELANEMIASATVFSEWVEEQE